MLAFNANSNQSSAWAYLRDSIKWPLMFRRKELSDSVDPVIESELNTNAQKKINSVRKMWTFQIINDGGKKVHNWRLIASKQHNYLVIHVQITQHNLSPRLMFECLVCVCSEKCNSIWFHVNLFHMSLSFDAPTTHPKSAVIRNSSDVYLVACGCCCCFSF